MESKYRSSPRSLEQQLLHKYYNNQYRNYLEIFHFIILKAYSFSFVPNGKLPMNTY